MSWLRRASSESASTQARVMSPTGSAPRSSARAASTPVSEPADAVAMASMMSCPSLCWAATSRAARAPPW